MGATFQITIDCADADRLARFWAEALSYVPAPPPDGFTDWDAYYRWLGVPEDELDAGLDRLVDPDGAGPGVWFQQVPEGKAVKNRLHLDIRVSGERTAPLEERRQRIDAKVRQMVELGATVTLVHDDLPKFYAVTLQDPEGNEFCLN